MLSALFALCILPCALSVGACAKAQAKAAPEGPPLAVPPPPPRVLAPVEPAEPVAANPPAPEPAGTTRPPTNARPAAPTPPRQRPPTTVTTTEPEPKPAETPTAAAPAPEPPPAPARPADAAAEARVRTVMRKASSDLGRITFQRLSADGKGQYQQAQRFVEQAEQALKDRNYAFAETLADKAAKVATELLGR